MPWPPPKQIQAFTAYEAQNILVATELGISVLKYSRRASLGNTKHLFCIKSPCLEIRKAQQLCYPCYSAASSWTCQEQGRCIYVPYTARCTVITEITFLAFTLMKTWWAGICSKLSRWKSHSRKCCLLYYGRSAEKELKKNKKIKKANKKANKKTPMKNTLRSSKK